MSIGLISMMILVSIGFVFSVETVSGEIGETYRYTDEDDRYKGWEASPILSELPSPTYSTDFTNSSWGGNLYLDDNNHSHQFVQGDGSMAGHTVSTIKYLSEGTGHPRIYATELDPDWRGFILPISDDLSAHTNEFMWRTRLNYDDGSSCVYLGGRVELFPRQALFRLSGDYDENPEYRVAMRVPYGSTSEYKNFGVSWDAEWLYLFMGQHTHKVNWVDSGLSNKPVNPSLAYINDFFIQPFGLTPKVNETFYFGDIHLYNETITDEQYKNSLELRGAVSLPPWNKDFAYTLDHHADDLTTQQALPILDYLKDEGIRLAFSVFVDGWPGHSTALTNRNQTYVDKIIEVRDAGAIELGVHGGGSTKAPINRSVMIGWWEDFYDTFGHYPLFNTDHGGVYTNFANDGMNESNEAYVLDYVLPKIEWGWVHDHVPFEGQDPIRADQPRAVDLIASGYVYEQWWRTEVLGGRYEIVDGPGIRYTYEHPDGHGSIDIAHARNPLINYGGGWGHYNIPERTRNRGALITHTYLERNFQVTADGVTYTSNSNDRDNLGYEDWYDAIGGNRYYFDNNGTYEISDGFVNDHEWLFTEYNVWNDFPTVFQEREDLWKNIELSIDTDEQIITITNNNFEMYNDASITLTHDLALYNNDNTTYFASEEISNKEWEFSSEHYGDWTFKDSSTVPLYGYYIGDVPPGVTQFHYTEREEEWVDGVAGHFVENNKIRYVGRGREFISEEQTVQIPQTNKFFSTPIIMNEYGNTQLTTYGARTSKEIGTVNIDSGVLNIAEMTYNDNTWSEVDVGDTLLYWSKSVSDANATTTYSISTDPIMGASLQRRDNETDEWSTIDNLDSGSEGLLQFSITGASQYKLVRETSLSESIRSSTNLIIMILPIVVILAVVKLIMFTIGGLGDKL